MDESLVLLSEIVGLMSLIAGLLMIVIGVVSIFGTWKMYEKAGYAGWKCIIPFYSMYCLAQMSMGNGWLFLLGLVPCVNFVWAIILPFNVAKAFGKGTVFAILTVLFAPITYAIIGFSDAQYVGSKEPAQF